MSARFHALNLSLRATVDEVVPTADPTSRSFPVKASLPAAEGLFPGMFGRLGVRVGTAERTVISSKAICRVGQLTYVYLQTGDGLVRRFVRAGVSASGDTDILSGLSPGDTVLVQDS